LRVLFAGEPSRWLCKETIDQAIYDTAVSLTRPARRRRRRRRLCGVQRRGRLTAMRMIDERPVEVEDRVQAGHWEGDLIMGAGNRSAIGTLVERTARYLVLLRSLTPSRPPMVSVWRSPTRSRVFLSGCGIR
jgi:IS30 family transposase